MSQKPTMTSEQRLMLIKLRETGMSLSMCKEALEQSNYDYDKAFEIVNKLALELAKKKAQSDANERVIIAKKHMEDIFYFTVATQTDFMMQSERFIDLCNYLIDYFIQNPSCSLLNDPVSKEKIENFIAQSGENILIFGQKIFKAQGQTKFYLHSSNYNKKTPVMGRFLGMIDYKCAANADESILNRLCNHVVAFEQDTLENFKKQNWIVNSSKTVSDILNENHIEIINICRVDCSETEDSANENTVPAA